MDDNRLERIEQKIDVVATKTNDVVIILTKQHEVLKDHTRRSIAAEENIALLRADVKPLQKRMAQAEGAFKLIVMLAVVASIAEGVMSILSYLHH